MPTKLKRLILKELSLVDRPANTESVVTIFKRGEPPITTEDANMAEKTELEKMQEQIADLTKRAEQAEAVAKLSDDEKAYVKELPEGDKKPFMDMKPEERAEKMRVSKAADEVMIVEGEEIRKSVVGAGMFNVIKAQQKRLDDQANDVKKAKGEAEMATMRKRADDDFSHLPGTTDERASILKAMGAMEEPVRKNLEAVLKAGEEAIKAGFTAFGSTIGRTAPGSAAEELETLTKAYAKEHKVSDEIAYDAVVQKHADLYERVLKEGK